MVQYLQDFIARFSLPENPIMPDEATIKKYESLLPKDLIDFWKECGFGNYGSGLIKVINPSDYEDVAGINKAVDIPLFTNAFGDIFIYRNMPEKNVKAIGILNIHFRNREFFIVDEHCIEQFISGIDPSLPIMRSELFKEALKKHGNLQFREIFFFAPALALGGSEDIKYVDKGDAFVHYLLLAQMLGDNFKAQY